MILTKQAYDRFLKLFTMFIRFVAEELDIKDLLSARAPEPQDVLDVSHLVWGPPNHRDLIASFVADNPMGLNRTDLNEVARWDKGIFGSFDVMRWKSDVYYIHGGYAFAVRGVFDEADIIGDRPTTRVEALILPFESVIVQGLTCQDIYQMPGGIGIWSIAYTLEELLTTKRVARTARQFMGVADTARAAGYTPQRTDLAAIEPRPQHVGSLVGLTWEDRAQAIEADVLPHNSEDKVLGRLQEHFDGACLKGEPTSEMAKVLARRSRQELVTLAERVGVPRARTTQVSRLIPPLIEAMPKEPENLIGLSILNGRKEVEHVKRVFDAGGRVDGRAADHDGRWTLPSFSWPAVVLFRTKDGYAAMMPDMVMESLENADWDALYAIVDELDLAVRHACLTAQIRGIVPLAEVVADCKESLHINESPEAIIEVISKRVGSVDATYALANIDGVTHVVDRYLGRGFLEPYRLRRRDEGYARELLDAHATIPARPVASITDGSPYARLMDYMADQPCHRELARYLDAHVTEDDGDLYFADAVLEALTFKCAMSRPEDVTTDALDAVLVHYGLDVFEEDWERVEQMLTALICVAPNWYNNGWPVTHDKG